MEGLGDYARAIRSGTMAASVAQEIGDPEMEGFAWGYVSHAHLLSGRKRTARNVTRRAQGAARNQPSGIAALLAEALAEAKIGDKFATFGLVSAAERALDRLPGTGRPGHLFQLSPSWVKAQAGRLLATIGMYNEAMPRLDESAAVLVGTDGSMKAMVWLSQARCLLGTGDLDGALELASVAVAHEAVVRVVTN